MARAMPRQYFSGISSGELQLDRAAGEDLFFPLPEDDGSVWTIQKVFIFIVSIQILKLLLHFCTNHRFHFLHKQESWSVGICTQEKE